MQSNPRSLRKNRKAASPAVSMVIITAATVALVLVASGYALQVLWRQQATAEFETMQNSVSAFDDALRDIAWDEGGSRSVRFTTKYGNMLLISNGKTYTISGAGFIKNNVNNPFTFTTGAVKYQMPYAYGGYVASDSVSAYFIGNESAVVSRLSGYNESIGQAFVGQEPGQASINLNYRVRVQIGGSVEIRSPPVHWVNYVDIFVINLISEGPPIPAGDFDLVCKNIGLRTESFDEIIVSTNPLLSVYDGTRTDFVDLEDLGLEPGDSVIFNLIIADVRVST